MALRVPALAEIQGALPALLNALGLSLLNPGAVLTGGTG